MPPMKPKIPQLEDPALADTWSPATIARRWDVSLSLVREMLASGELQFCQISGKLRVPKAAVVALERQTPKRLPEVTKVRKRRDQGK